MKKQTRKRVLGPMLTPLLKESRGTCDYVDKLELDYVEKERRFKIGTVRKLCFGKATVLEDEPGPGYRRICLTQLSRELFEYLIPKLSDTKYKVSFFEPARDYLFNDRESADELRGYLSEYVTLPDDAECWTTPYIIGDTSYSGPESSDFRYVIYNDRPSKLVGGICCHTEFRLRGKVLDQFGFRKMEDIAEFDHESFWNRNLKPQCSPFSRTRTRACMRAY